MDSITEKFSVFDFFNLIIGGALFIIGIGVSNPQQISELCITLTSIVKIFDTSNVLSVVVFFALSLVVGTFLNEISNWLFERRLHLESVRIKACLQTNSLIHSKIRLERLQRKAKKHYFSDDSKTDFKEDECSGFYAHCVYYLHVHHQDMKTEKLRETQGLSELLTIVFAAIPITSIILYACYGIENIKLIQTVVLYLLCIVFAFTFFNRAKRALENRIKMVLAVYDACTDMEKINNSDSKS